MYRIGEFSKIVDLSVKTLRYYDAVGILCPGKIDEFTGYRYYNEENIKEAELIKLLKSVNFSLEEILNYKDNLTTEVFEYKKEQILDSIKDLKIKYEKLTILQNNLTKNAKILRKKDE
ncbi:MAG: MerR family transcriptional regulator [Firmicutes bacterium]|nr:MerR family transcriptional regulator [Bacillota bacterium]